MNSLSEPTILADDTSVIICGKKLDDFCTVSNLVLSHKSKWFAANKLVLSLDETDIIEFITNSLLQYMEC
jgi:hypothetical protein